MGAAARRSASPRATKRVGERGGAETGQMAVFDAPRGTGPYGIATTPMARSGARTRTLGCRVRRRQTVRAEGRVGEGRARDPRPGVCEQQEDWRSHDTGMRRREPTAPRGRCGCFRDCLFHNAPDVYCHANEPAPRSSPLTGTRGKAWRLRLRGGVPRPRSLNRPFPERQICRPNLGPHSPNSPRAVRRKSPDNSAMVRGRAGERRYRLSRRRRKGSR